MERTTLLMVAIQLIALILKPVQAQKSSDELLNIVTNGLEFNLSSIQDIRATVKYFRTVDYSEDGSRTEKFGSATLVQKGTELDKDCVVDYDYTQVSIDSTGKRSELKLKLTEGKIEDSTQVRQGKSLFILPKGTRHVLSGPLIYYLGIGNKEILKELHACDASERKLAKLEGWSTYNGDTCLVVTIPWSAFVRNKSPVLYLYRLWVAPAKGFVIPRWQTLAVWGTNTVVYHEQKIKFRQLNSKWVPAIVEERLLNPIITEEFKKALSSKSFSRVPKYRLVNETYIEFGDIYFNTHVQASDVQVKLPKNTLVHDLIRGTTYWLGDDR